jgi:hypothetical protein
MTSSEEVFIPGGAAPPPCRSLATRTLGLLAYRCCRVGCVRRAGAGSPAALSAGVGFVRLVGVPFEVAAEPEQETGVIVLAVVWCEAAAELQVEALVVGRGSGEPDEPMLMPRNPSGGTWLGSDPMPGTHMRSRARSGWEGRLGHDRGELTAPGPGFFMIGEG